MKEKKRKKRHHVMYCGKTAADCVLGRSVVTSHHTWVQHKQVLPILQLPPSQPLTAGPCQPRHIQRHWCAWTHSVNCAGGHPSVLLRHPCVLGAEVAGEAYGASARAGESLGSAVEAACWLYKQPYIGYFLISECLSRLFEHYFNMVFVFLLNGVLYTPAAIVPLVPLRSGVQWMFTCLCLK